jgi:hypothetical protein
VTQAGTIEEKKMSGKTNMVGAELTREVAKLAAGKKHSLAPYLVDGQHGLKAAQAGEIIAYLRRCPDLPRRQTTEEPVVRQQPEQPEQTESRPVIADINGGFYATPSRTGHNDLDFWKVTEGKKPGIRFVKRVIGGGTDRHPKLVEISRTEGFTALNAILRAGIEKAAEDYAINEKRCIKCGIQLTDDLSRERRMGPDCWGKHGE